METKNEPKQTVRREKTQVKNCDDKDTTKNKPKKYVTKYWRGIVLREMLTEKGISTKQIVALIGSSEEYRHQQIKEYRMDKILNGSADMTDEEWVMIIDLAKLNPLEAHNRLKEYVLISVRDGIYASKIKTRRKEGDEDED